MRYTNGVDSLACIHTCPTDVTGAAPTIFSAIEQQLGLKLKPVKAQADVLVIDHAEKDPIEN